MKQYNNAIVEKAHDVRTLRPCCGCGGIGNADSMVERVVPGRSDMYHGRCYISKFGEASFFALPETETNKMRLDDIGVARMKRLVGTK